MTKLTIAHLWEGKGPGTDDYLVTRTSAADLAEALAGPGDSRSPPGTTYVLYSVVAGLPCTIPDHFPPVRPSVPLLLTSDLLFRLPPRLFARMALSAIILLYGPAITGHRTALKLMRSVVPGEMSLCGPPHFRGIERKAALAHATRVLIRQFGNGNTRESIRVMEQGITIHSTGSSDSWLSVGEGHLARWVAAVQAINTFERAASKEID